MKIIIPIPTYRVYLDVYIYSNKKKLQKICDKTCKKLKYDKCKFAAQGMAFDLCKDKDSYLRATMILNKKYITPGLLAHESLHIINYIFDYISIEYSRESEEAYTYLLEYLVNSINNELK